MTLFLAQPFRRLLVVLLALALVAVAIALITSTSAAGAAPGEHLWSKRLGDVNEQQAQSVAVDAAGDILVTGYFAGSVDFGGGPLTTPSYSAPDIFLAKFDAAGAHMWSKRFGDSGTQRAFSVAVDAAGNVFITGDFFGSVDFGGGPLSGAGAGDIFLAKFDADGNHIWSKRFGDAGIQNGTSVAADDAGNVLVTGNFQGTVDLGGGPLTSVPGSLDIFLVKFDADGNHLWSKSSGYSGVKTATGVAVDGAGNVLLTGYFGGSVDFGGPSGPLTSAGGVDIFLAKFDPAGNRLWSRQFGDANDQGAQSVAVDGVGNVFLTGRFRGSVDFGGGPLIGGNAYHNIYLAKFDSAGNHIWSKRFGDANHNQEAQSVAVDAGGSVFVTGYFDGSMDFGDGQLTSADGFDIFLAKFGPTGNHLWSKRFGDSDYKYAWSVAVDGTGNVLLTGYYTGSVDFGGGPLTSAGNYDLFLAKFIGASTLATPTPTPTDTQPSTGTTTPTPTRTSTTRPTPIDTPARTPTPTTLVGDVTCDHDINAIDALYILQFTASLIHVLPCLDAADVNLDGTTDPIDAALILQYVAGLLDTLPPRAILFP